MLLNILLRYRSHDPNEGTETNNRLVIDFRQHGYRSHDPNEGTETPLDMRQLLLRWTLPLPRPERGY